jgi:hypothetical protein
MGKTAGYIFARKQPKEISTFVISSRFLDIVYKLYKFEEFLFLVPNLVTITEVIEISSIGQLLGLTSEIQFKSYPVVSQT